VGKEQEREKETVKRQGENLIKESALEGNVTEKNALEEENNFLKY